MSFYRRHMFVCANQRDDGTSCCASFNAQQARDYLKKRAKEAGIHGAGDIRVNTAGCLGRCDEGPVIVIYPEAVWYTYVDGEDLDEIFTEHLIQGRVVERLRINPEG